MKIKFDSDYDEIFLYCFFSLVLEWTHSSAVMKRVETLYQTNRVFQHDLIGILVIMTKGLSLQT